MTGDTAKLLFSVAFLAIGISGFFLARVLRREKRLDVIVKAQNSELESDIRRCVEWAEGLEASIGFEDQLEASRNEFRSASRAARIVLAAEGKISETWLLRVVYKRLKAAGENIVRFLPHGSSHEYDCLI